MFKNIPSRTLLIIFGVLLLLAILFVYYDSQHEERTFTRDIVNIDTSKVNSISIFPKVTNHKEVNLFKEGNYWLVRLENNKSVPADQGKIKNLLNLLVQLKSNGVAAQQESKWTEFQVDTSGIRVQVNEGSSTTLDIIIGKFAFQQPRTALTYVRLKGDNIVHEVSGFLEFTFNQKPNDFRNSILISDNYDDWKSLSFIYPADSSFQLRKDTSGYWNMDGMKTDSSKTIDVFRSLSRLSSADFADNVDQSLLSLPVYTLKIERSNNIIITITAQTNLERLLIRSSQNTDAYFDGKVNSLWQQIFKSRKDFLKK